MAKGIRQVLHRFEARIKDGVTRRSIGFFDTAEEAYAAYSAAKAVARAKYPSLGSHELTVDRLKTLIHYDPLTGIFTRLTSAGGVEPGIECGGISKIHGYRYLRIDGRRYPAHQIAWFYMTGSLPDDRIDHRNGRRADNRFANLRPATYAENNQNRSALSSNIAGLRGVSWHAASGKFVARIMRDGKQHQLGYFRDPQAAHAAYLEAKSRLHEFQPIPRDL